MNEEEEPYSLGSDVEDNGDKDGGSPGSVEENNEENDQDSLDSNSADWVDVSSGGVDEGDWAMPNDLQARVKDAGRLLVEGFRKL